MISPPAGVSHPHPHPPPTPTLTPSPSLETDVLNEGQSEEVVQKRREAPADPQSPEDTVECYRWRCRQLRKHFNPHEADQHRMLIPQRDYWELECLHYHDALQKLMWTKARAAHGADGEPTTDHWRAVAMLYRDLLMHGGVSLAQVRESRLSIEDQKYWRCEAGVYRQKVELLEQEAQEALRKRDERAAQQPPPASAEDTPVGRVTRTSTCQPETSTAAAGQE